MTVLFSLALVADSSVAEAQLLTFQEYYRFEVA